jgi:hypothetical protein
MFLTLLTLIAIFLIDGTLGKAFDSQRNNKDIFRNDSRGKQCAKEMLRNNHATFCTIPLKSETNDGPASTCEQLSVSDNGPAITTSSFLQLPNDSPAKQTPVPVTMTATTKVLRYQLTQARKTINPLIMHPAKKAANYATPICLLLLPVSNGTAITTTNPGLLLPFNQDNPAITMTNHANSKLQLIVE